MKAVILLTLVLWVAFWLVDRPRRRSYKAMVRRAYDRFDTAFGIKAKVLQNRATARRRYGWFLGRRTSEFLWPATQYGGVAALPWFRKREQFITLHLRKVRWPRRYRTVRDWYGITASWTTEVDATTSGFVDRAERAFADLLYLKWKPGLFDVHDHRDDKNRAGKLTLTLARPVAVPDELPASRELA